MQRNGRRNTRKQGGGYSTLRKGTVVEDLLARSSCKSTVTDSSTAFPAPRYIYRVESLADWIPTQGANQARSFDIRESHSGTSDRPPVSKSFSFGGYPAPQVCSGKSKVQHFDCYIFFQQLEPRRVPGGCGPPGASYRSSPHPPALPRGQVCYLLPFTLFIPDAGGMGSV